MGRGTGLVPTSSRKEQAKGQADVLHHGTETGNHASSMAKFFCEDTEYHSRNPLGNQVGVWPEE